MEVTELTERRRAADRERDTKTHLWWWQRRSPPRPAVGWSAGSCRCYWAPAPLSARWSCWTSLSHWPPVRWWYCPSGCARRHPAISRQLEDNHRRPRKSGPPRHPAADWIQAPKSPQAWSRRLETGTGRGERGGGGDEDSGREGGERGGMGVGEGGWG